MSRMRWSLASVLAAAVLVGSPTLVATQPKPLGKVTVGLGVAKTFTFLPAYVAEDLGSHLIAGVGVRFTAVDERSESLIDRFVSLMR